ncbi:hypothetical protein WMY93_024580 [Mugilogobius chulae]|uniref:MHC class I antigen n=1 Tax=Mugilogobius chulae TaxID=88201 RepID=A0AAW0N4U1_9GOBI
MAVGQDTPLSITFLFDYVLVWMGRTGEAELHKSYFISAGTRPITLDCIRGESRGLEGVSTWDRSALWSTLRGLEVRMSEVRSLGEKHGVKCEDEVKKENGE